MFHEFDAAAPGVCRTQTLRNLAFQNRFGLSLEAANSLPAGIYPDAGWEFTILCFWKAHIIRCIHLRGGGDCFLNFSCMHPGFVSIYHLQVWLLRYIAIVTLLVKLLGCCHWEWSCWDSGFLGAIQHSNGVISIVLNQIMIRLLCPSACLNFCYCNSQLICIEFVLWVVICQMHI